MAIINSITFDLSEKENPKSNASILNIFILKILCFIVENDFTKILRFSSVCQIGFSLNISFLHFMKYKCVHEIKKKRIGTSFSFLNCRNNFTHEICPKFISNKKFEQVLLILFMIVQNILKCLRSP